MYLILSKQKLNKNVLVDISEPHFFQRMTSCVQSSPTRRYFIFTKSCAQQLFGRSLPSKNEFLCAFICSELKTGKKKATMAVNY